MVIQGLIRTIFSSVASLFLFESLVRRHFSMSCMAIAVYESLVGVLAILYFMFLSKSADGLIYIATACSIISFAGVQFYPEPPRYLIKKKEYAQA